MAEPRAAAAGKAADVQESGTGKTERLLPTGQPSPEISSLPGVRLVLTSSDELSITGMLCIRINQSPALHVPPLMLGTVSLLSSCVTMQETRGRSEK